MTSDEIAIARAWIQTKYPSDVKMVGEVTNPGREADFIDGYTQGRADVLNALKERLQAMEYSAKQFPQSQFGSGQISSFGAMLILIDELLPTEAK